MDTYLNIGSIENFREYYTTYAEVAIGEYEHWEEEEWVDAANPDWQKFIGQLSQELNEKGVDGFFIDNCDVYDYAPHESIFEGLTAILQNMMTFGKAVIINGGDTYVAEYRERYECFPTPNHRCHSAADLAAWHPAGRISFRRTAETVRS